MNLFTSEEKVWNDFISGSEAALTWIYRNYVQALFNYGKQFVQDDDLVQDAIQDLFYNLISSREKLGPTTSIRFYLYSSLRRIIVRKLKKAGRLQKESLDHDNRFQVAMEIPNPGFHGLDQEQTRILESAFNKLPEKQREALMLLYYEGMKYHEIAKLLRIGEVKSARSLVYRALKSMKDLLCNLKQDLV
jgi:RNA polymerase sigma-70 factor (ECF subfamily)